MTNDSNNGSGFSIKLACPAGGHHIEWHYQLHSVVAIPHHCPTCGMGLPETLRLRVREILNIARFQDGRQDASAPDVEIISA